MRISLTPDEAIIIETIALNRKAYDEGNSIPDHLATDKDPDEVAIDSLGAEFAVCKLLNMYPPITWTEIIGHDLVVKGKRWDVKQVDRGKPYISIRSTRRVADYYIGVRGEMPNYEVIGWISAAKAKAGPPLDGYKGTKYWRVPLSRLRPLPLRRS